MMRWLCAEPTRSCRPRSLMSAKCQRGDTSSNIPPKVTLPLTQRYDPLPIFFFFFFLQCLFFSFLFLTNPDALPVGPVLHFASVLHFFFFKADEELRWPSAWA